MLYEGGDLADLSGDALRAQRKRMQMIFQDPYASLNSRMTVGDIVGEPLLVHKMGDQAASARPRCASSSSRWASTRTR